MKQNKLYTICLKGKHFYLLRKTCKNAFTIFKKMFPELANGFQFEEEYKDKNSKHFTFLKRTNNPFTIAILDIKEE